MRYWYLHATADNCLASCFHSAVDFLASAVNQLELAIREEDGERNARETATTTEIEDFCSWTEMYGLRDSHGVKHVVLIQVVDILAADHVDFGVPVTIESVQLCYLFFLLVAEIRKIFLYDIHAYCFNIWVQKYKKNTR